MRFVFAVHGWYLGGFATFCRNLSLGLRGRGHEVVLLVLPDAPLRSPVPAGVFDDCLVVTRGMRGLASHVRQVVQAIDRLEPEVLVLNDVPYGMAALPFIRRSIVRLPVLHSVSPEEVALGLRQEQWWDRMITVSEFVEKAATGGRRDLRISVCPLGVPVPAAEEGRLRREDRSPLEIISVSRVEIYQKRMDRVPLIARLLVEQGIAFHWTILGDGEYLPQFCRELNQMGLMRHFSLQGAVASPVVAAALDAAEVFVLTSDCEGMPQALLEAMAHGVVPVVSRIPGSTTGLVEAPQCGYVCPPTETRAFAHAIAELARHRARCAELGKRAAAHIAQHFSLEAFTQRFLTLVLEARAQAETRPAPLPVSRWQPGASAYRCLGFWRSLRHQSLGQLKRWLLQQRAETRVAPWRAVEDNSNSL